MDEPDNLQSELDRLDSLLRSLQPQSRVNSAQITVSAGGVGVWIAATASILCLFAVMVLTMLYIDQRREVDDLGDYLNAIYMQAPHLKPKEESE